MVRSISSSLRGMMDLISSKSACSVGRVVIASRTPSMRSGRVCMLFR
jgi:hypothetical protein